MTKLHFFRNRSETRWFLIVQLCNVQRSILSHFVFKKQPNATIGGDLSNTNTKQCIHNCVSLMAFHQTQPELQIAQKSLGFNN